MLQSKQILKQEIISALDFLSPESLQLLARFVSFLRSNLAQEEISNFETTIERTQLPPVATIRGPRLVKREQLADFRKEIIAIEPYYPSALAS